jgi:hypothetical protein
LNRGAAYYRYCGESITLGSLKTQVPELGWRAAIPNTDKMIRFLKRSLSALLENMAESFLTHAK